MSTDPNIVVGGGQAGARAAQSMRQAGFAGRIIVFGDEVHLPYERPPLSKEVFLRGPDAGFKPILTHEFYQEQNIELRRGVHVEAIDRQAQRIVLEDGSALPFNRLLLATGSRLRRLQLEGAEKSNVFYLRTIDDSVALEAMLSGGSRLMIVGGGFIGLELAAAAQQRGCNIVVIEAGHHIMGRVAPPVVASYVADCHAARGVTIKTGVFPIVLAGDANIHSVTLSDGETLPVDIMVVGIGVVPRTELAERAGLAVENGISVDESCVTSDPGIFAAGDVANQFNPTVRCRLRQESYQNAQDQGVTAGTAMAGGRPATRPSVPWAWSDQYDLNIQVAGMRLPSDEVVIRGDVASGSFTAFSLFERRLRGAVTVNRGREMTLINRLLLRGEPIDTAALSSESVSLREVSSLPSTIGTF